jgi:integrase/recombinase XerD
VVREWGSRARQVTPGHLGTYFNEHPGSIPTKKQHLAAVRGLFDALVLRHAAIPNLAASVRLERYQVVEGKTPEITVAQACTMTTGTSLRWGRAGRHRSV